LDYRHTLNIFFKFVSILVQRKYTFMLHNILNESLSCKLWNSKQNYGQYRNKPGLTHFPSSNVLVLEIMPRVSKTWKTLLEVARWKTSATELHISLHGLRQESQNLACLLAAWGPQFILCGSQMFSNQTYFTYRIWPGIASNNFLYKDSKTGLHLGP